MRVALLALLVACRAPTTVAAAWCDTDWLCSWPGDGHAHVCLSTGVAGAMRAAANLCCLEVTRCFRLAGELPDEWIELR